MGDGISLGTKVALSKLEHEDDAGSKRTDMRNEPEPALNQSVGKLRASEKQAQEERSTRVRQSNPYKQSRGVYGD